MPRLLPVVALVVGSLLMAGCVPEPEPVVTPTATVEPSSVAEAAVRPNPVFDLTCAEVLSLDEVQARVTAPIAVKRDEADVPGELADIIPLQSGAMSCLWGAEGTWEDDVSLLLLPEGDARIAELTADPYVAEFSVAGADRALGFCGFGRDVVDGAAPGWCSITAMVGTAALDLRFSDTEGAYGTEAEIGSAAVELLELATSRVVSAGPREQQWTAPADPIEADAAFCDMVGSDLLAALGLETEFGGASSDELLAGVSTCTYSFGATDVPSVTVSVLRGASWVAGVEQTEGPWLGEPFQRQSTASGALWWLSAMGEGVRTRAAMGGSLLELAVYAQDVDLSVDVAVAAITSVMEQYAEAPPGT